MGLESASWIDDLVVTNPVVGDQVSAGDDHLRLIKTVLKACFPSAGKAWRFPTSETKSANYTVLSTDQNKLLSVDATAAGRTMTLPTLAAGDAGWQIIIQKSDSTSNTVTTAPASGTIQGAASIAMAAQYEALLVYWTGTAWLAFGLGIFPTAVARGGTGAATAAAARTNLAVPGLAVENQFTANQEVRTAGSAAWKLHSTTTTPPQGTICGIFHGTGLDDAGATVSYGQLRVTVEDDTAGSVDGKLEFFTPVSSGLGVRFNIIAGLYTQDAVGNDQGAGSINADAFYDDGVAVCFVIEEAKNGSFDRTKWAKLEPYKVIDVHLSLKAKGFNTSSYKSYADEVLSHGAVPGLWNQAEYAAREAETKKNHKGEDIISRVSHTETSARMQLAMDYMSLALVSVSNELEVQKLINADIIKRLEKLEAKP